MSHSAICPSCNNIMTAQNELGSITFVCSCKTSYQGSEKDTLVYEHKKDETYDAFRTGRAIWCYPSNQKIQKTCPKCKKYDYVAWEYDHNKKNRKKIYGCRCDFSWQDVIVKPSNEVS